MEFNILKKSKKSKARLGILKTAHGLVETPAFVPVATQAAIKALTVKEFEETGSQIAICNTYHLHSRPGEKIIKAGGGLHNFMNFKKLLMTDSGGFQVFSLGFGRDQNVGKLIKYFPGGEAERIEKGQQPKFLKITNDGVWFNSPFDGRKIFLGPEESIKVQEDLGADIIFAFDECTSPLSKKDYVKKSLERTHRWAEICLKTKKNKKQSLFGIAQGSRFKDLREESARFINSLSFDGFGIGGDLGKSKAEMIRIINWSVACLDELKPRHLLGIGHLEDMEPIIKSGIDLFDCITPTHYARHGVAFTSHGRLDLKQSRFLRDKNSLDKKCDCFVCANHKRNYLCHLMKVKELSGLSLLTFHNLFFFNSHVAKIREKIKKGML